MMSKAKFDLGLFGDEGVKTKNLVSHLNIVRTHCRLKRISTNS